MIFSSRPFNLSDDDEACAREGYGKVGSARTLLHRGNTTQVVFRQVALQIASHMLHRQAENGIILLSAYAAGNGPSKQKDACGVSA